MSIAKITVEAVEALKQGETLWDTSVKGFGARRQRHAAVYVFKNRQKGQQRFVTIGRHGAPWTPSTAREEARRLAGTPVAGTGQDGVGVSFGELARTYLDRHSALHKKPRSFIEDQRNLEQHILPVLGDLPVAGVTREVVSRFHAGRRSRPANANRCLAVISHIFTMAERWGITPAGTNPCRGIERYRELPRERYLSEDEFRRLGEALRAAGSEPGRDWRAIAVLQLLLVTGARLSEILTLEWRFIEWQQGFARLPDSKTGPRTLILPRHAMDVLKRVRDEHGSQSRFVFPGKRKNTWFTGIQKPWQILRRDAELEDVRIHDLRHSFASLAVAKGESLYLVGHVLGHRRATTTQRYAHVAVAPVLDVADRTADHLIRLLESDHDVRK
jgi:integrase